jgi:hypothetical protein
LAAVVIAVALPLAPARAQGLCSAGTLADYVALGPSGCLVDGLVFSGFTLGPEPPSGSGVRTIPADAVGLTPITTTLDGRSYTGLRVSDLRGLVAATSEGALANGDTCADARWCYLEWVTVYFDAQVTTVGGSPVALYGVANMVRDLSRSGTWTAIAAAQTVADFGLSAELVDVSGPEGQEGACAPDGPLCPGAVVIPNLGGVGLFHFIGSAVAAISPLNAATPPTGAATAAWRSSDYLFAAPAVIPEPTTLLLVGTGLLVVGAAVSLRSRKRATGC